ncbi:MAG TPA: squalene--hopene cyclase [Dehalococcoidia bacterium]|nr:squalene--hopene cyclase [Dehalococcoidia bacterium]
MTQDRVEQPTASRDAVSLDEAIARSQEYFLRTQDPQGFWWGELESNVTMAAEYLLLTHFLGCADPERWRKLANYIRARQRQDGTWPIYYNGPSDINATVESYFALKLAGVSPDDPMMIKAQEFILSCGGVAKTRIFTRIWLSLFGQWDWRGIPVLPPELMFAPRWFPITIYEFGSWARATVVAMLILLTKRPVVPIPGSAAIDELYAQPRSETDYRMAVPPRGLSWKYAFHLLDGVLRRYERVAIAPLRRRALAAAEKWIVDHQEADGSWGGIQPPWVYSLMALKVQGYELDHPVMQKGLEGLETSFAIEEEETFSPQACLSPVWDTCLAMIGLLNSGMAPDHPALVTAGRWLIKEQVLTGGDWQVKAKSIEPGGWSFEFENDLYPDTDDAAEVMIALHQVRLPDEVRRERAIDKGVRWLLGMQSQNGGWGAFDKDNTQRLITKIPFCDFGEVIDYPTEDVTAHIVELLGYLGYRNDHPAMRRALDYLYGTQEPDGCWWGRWGVNYVYGTGAVLPALQLAGEDMAGEPVQRALRWLSKHQNPDGGWGETCDSYADPSLRGQGPSTASQTAWALLALLAAYPANNADATLRRSIDRGIGFLLETQLDTGEWDEPYFTGTGFPRDFYLNYHLYRNYWPLMALGRYRALLGLSAVG